MKTQDPFHFCRIFELQERILCQLPTNGERNIWDNLSCRHGDELLPQHTNQLLPHLRSCDDIINDITHHRERIEYLSINSYG